MKLGVLISHPVQYYTPIFRELAKRCHLHVFYGQRISASQQARTGFGHAFDWDIELMSGYRSTVLENVSANPGPDHFTGCDTPEIWERLQEGRYDALVTAGWYLKCHVQAVLAAKRIGLPVLVRGDSHLGMTSSVLKRCTKALVNPPFLRLFDGALYVGEKSRAFYAHYRYPAERLFFSPHCVDNEWFAARATPEARSRIRTSLGISPAAFVVLFAGKLVPFKRPSDVIAAAALCRDQGRPVEVLVAGSGELEAEMRSLATVSGVPLHMLGFCNQTKMPEAYAASDALVLPSNGEETWGLVANEALACGRPLIVSDACGCAPDLVGDGLAGRVVPMGDIQSLASAIGSLMDGRPTARAIQERADRYSVEAAVQGILRGAEGVRRVSALRVGCIKREAPFEPSGGTRRGRLRILVLFGSASIFGAERGNLEALMALKARGAEILCLIRPEPWSVQVPSALDARGIAWRKVPYVEQWRRNRAHAVLLCGPKAWIVANWRFLKAVREFKPTHIHTYAQLFLANFLLGLMLVKTPLVFRAGDEPTYHNAFWREIWRYTVKRVNRFVVNSGFVAHSLRRHGVEDRKISLIYNAPPSRPSSDADQHIDSAPGENLIVYVGQIAEHKGPHLLVEAFRPLVGEYPDVRLMLIGPIHPWWEGDAWARSFRDAVMADGVLQHRVQFAGDLEDIPAVMHRSTFVVVPSMFDDPAPNVVMEAKNAGRAVIGFPRGGIPELIEHNVDGQICGETTTAALSAALRTYLDDPDLARRHGDAARRSLARFEIPRFGDKWQKVYELACQPSGIRAHKLMRGRPGAHH